jgi:DoxX-like family
MKPKIIVYWITTGMVAFSIGSGGIAQAMRVPGVIDGMMKLGYPQHFVVLLGVWKTLGAIVILLPGFPLVKEWAYAGIFIDLSGAVVTAVANASAAFHIVAPLLLIGMLATSWALRPESRRLRAGGSRT